MPLHVRNQHRISLPAPADVAFPFFTPKGEERWVPGWEPHYIHPASGETVRGLVFTTTGGGHTTLWQVADFDAASRTARYARVTPALHAGFVEINCQPQPGGQACDVTVTYDMTALTPEGEQALQGYEGETFTRMIDGWAEAVAGCLL
ncbi:MAG: SRPBCC family protein [Ramlibacter sp.]|nr:SRPBCC family protein [Ramlibacter sp.]